MNTLWTILENLQGLSVLVICFMIVGLVLVLDMGYAYQDRESAPDSPEELTGEYNGNH